MSVPITTEDGTKASITIYNGVSKKTGKAFKSVKVQVGEWSTLVFPTTFELKYLEGVLEEAE